MPRSPVTCQSPASRPPIDRLLSLSPAASRTPATRQPLASRSLVALLSLTSCRARPTLAMQMRNTPSGTHQASRFACRSLSRTPAARLPLARLPLACHSPVARQRCMSGAPPAARLPSASCSLAPCQLRACRSPVARQSLCESLCTGGSSGVAPIGSYCRPGMALSPLSALAVAGMPGSIPGWSPLPAAASCVPT